MKTTRTILLTGAASMLVATSVLAQVGPTNSQKPIPLPSTPSTPADLAKQLKTILQNVPQAPEGTNNAVLDNETAQKFQTFNAQVQNLRPLVEALPETATANAADNGGGGNKGGGNGGGANAGGGNGDSSKPTQSTPPIPNSDSNYLDDDLSWNMPVYIYRAGSDGIDLSKTFCLPSHVTVQGLDRQFTQGTPPNKTSAQNYLPVRIDDSSFTGKRLDAKLQDTGTGDAGALRCDNSQIEPVDLTKPPPGKPPIPAPAADVFPIYNDTEFYVGGTDLDRTASRAGWDFGTLVVPFKFQMSDKSIVTGSATLGGYVGYNIGLDMPGFRVSPVGFVDVSEISLPQDSGGKSSSQTVAGLSYGVGLMGTIKDSFNISLVFGADHVSGGHKSYQYQDKPWVSLALGYSFTK